MKKSGIVCLIVFPVWMLSLIGCREQFENHYSDLREAKEKGAVARGWVPESLPDSCSDIYEKHDVDTNEVWGRFAFQPNSVKQLSPSQPVALAEIARQRIRSPRSDWWPDTLTGTLDPKALQESGFSFERLRERGEFFVALDAVSGRGYFWAPAR